MNGNKRKWAERRKLFEKLAKSQARARRLAEKQAAADRKQVEGKKKNR
jgi:hypothetical protein